MRRILFFAALLFGSNLAAQNSDPSTWKPGQVLSEKSTDLGKGYREVARSQVNPPEHWEGVGHFVFVYFKEQRLCQCSANDISLSPNGRFAVFVNEQNGRLTLFNAATSTTSSLTDQYVGTPHSADWDLKRGRAVVHVRKWVKDKNGYERTKVPIELKSDQPGR
jgi:hypothetical protein